MSYNGKSSPKKAIGQFHKGNAVGGVGDHTRAQSWQSSKEEHAAGESKYNAARAKGYFDGAIDRAGGVETCTILFKY
ncbi:hypothetical protein BDP27DRAFT_1319406 [Rhodocollybia butyracea]|uniref:Uncharacterized protein n=1 Tax=Rhodocollybia butyracea TaxID=206335 RepID=A0A9P5PVA6_9AGAR|nr:hypothetical protein BDP27DRAFT_1319406 [Rhodocollybia butyracea]